MKTVGSDGAAILIQLGNREKTLLCELLTLYPIKPTGFYRLSKQADPRADQKLLDEILSEQKQETRQRVAGFVEVLNQLPPAGGGFRLKLDRSQIDWLLQILNEVRIGSWFALGAPEDKPAQPLRLTAQTAHFLWAMNLAGYFQANLLDLLRK